MLEAIEMPITSSRVWCLSIDMRCLVIGCRQSASRTHCMLLSTRLSKKHKEEISPAAAIASIELECRHAAQLCCRQLQHPFIPQSGMRVRPRERENETSHQKRQSQSWFHCLAQKLPVQPKLPLRLAAGGHASVRPHVESACELRCGGSVEQSGCVLRVGSAMIV